MDQNPPDQALQNPPDQAQRLQDQQPAIQQQRDAQNPVVAVTGPALQAIIQNAVQAGVAAYAQHAGQAALPADGASDGNASREHGKYGSFGLFARLVPAEEVRWSPFFPYVFPYPLPNPPSRPLLSSFRGAPVARGGRGLGLSCTRRGFCGGGAAAQLHCC